MLAASCEFRFLDQSHKNEIDEKYQDLIIRDVGQYQKGIVRQALNAVPPIVCAAVRRVVFVKDEDNNAIAFTNTTKVINEGRPADLIYFNNAAMPESLLVPRMVPVQGGSSDAQEVNRLAALRTVIHEAIHVADHMLDSQRTVIRMGDPQPIKKSLWPPQSLTLAAEATERNLLRPGFREEWQRIHNAFVTAGMAREYFGKNGAQDLRDIPKITGEDDNDGNPTEAKDEFGRPVMLKPAPIEFAGAGIMTRYGGSKVSEDIAEMAASVLTRMWVEENAPGRDDLDSAVEDHACRALQDMDGPGITPDVAAMYTKLGYLQSVGFITERGYRHCVGNLAIQADSEGFHSWKVDDLANRYTGDVQVGFGRKKEEDPVMFQMTAEGSAVINSGSVPVTIELEINVSPTPGLNPGSGYPEVGYLGVKLGDVSFPRGIYHVGSRYGSKNSFRIRREDNDGVIVEVSQGLLLVGRASTGLIEGTLVIQRIFNFSGGMLSAVAGDEPVGEPTRIAFRWEPEGSSCGPGIDCEIE